jgi:hypothetical protein
VWIGKGRKASFLANSTAVGKKNNAVDRPSPCDHRSQGVLQRVPKGSSGLLRQWLRLVTAQPMSDHHRWAVLPARLADGPRDKPGFYLPISV